MRTTIDIPNNLFRRAKIAAVERGTTLRELVGLALARELGLATVEPEPRQRTRFPIFQSGAPGSMDIGAEDLSRLESAEDIRRHG